MRKNPKAIETGQWRMDKDGRETGKDIQRRSRQFAVRIIKLASKLPRTPAGLVIARQLIKCGTSVGANTIEAQDASSKKDFINKMSIALRECKEAKYWLEVIGESGLLSVGILERDYQEADELCAIYSTIVKNAKKS